MLYTLNNPVTVGDLDNPRTITALRITALGLTTTPSLAPIGTGELYVTLTDAVTGWQETLKYQDDSVPAFFAQAAPAAANGDTVEDVMCGLVFAKLIADGRLPPGTLSAE